MQRTDWKRPCEDLADELRAACIETLCTPFIRLEDLTTDMLAEEGDPQVVPHHPIGLIYRHQLRERRTHFLFGRHWLPIRHWKTAVSFGLEEMFDSRLWTRHQGMWCIVRDERLTLPIRPIIERFSKAHRLNLDFTPRPA